ncbi:hypothetical protein KL930_000330 [Ogataea haglerorum]|uniref:Uncharacterized protein n=1 Tax=Ogataea haglerorum TaxID=1937702 RepID=A0AAN6D4S7_9ASCO|nr:uncharacterized protein KL911_000801 [Ogataea haglerorum]KAG7697615.1 hypothetical protein KL951_002189 [Ogataea haglerorum]KAG7701216.1 hypothetical protein KL915_000247 [Ogataea haglerorum]KAG7705877.1 hypothetical protein KL950_003453 [Ogataea haglerorum]KAG7709174.1 hypothetical protein KL914_001564 [Ogataea haglerorum]KAG7726956.1 hypothetical protein KL933_003239 [Ogataea haglerorum]
MELFIRASNSTISNLHLNGINEGSGIDYVFLAETELSNIRLLYNSVTRKAESLATKRQLMLLDKFVALSQGVSLTTWDLSEIVRLHDIAKGVTYIQGRIVPNNYADGNFYACTNASDPNGYSDILPELVYYSGIPEANCLKVYVYANLIEKGR